MKKGEYILCHLKINFNKDRKMKKQKAYILASALSCLLMTTSEMALASVVSGVDVDSATQSDNSQLYKAKSAKQRAAASQKRRSHTFSDLGQEYSDFKDKLSKEYGFDYSVDISYMAQRGAPNGKKTAYQTIYYPSFTWTTFQNDYGTGTLNFGYNIVRYGGSSAQRIGNNIGVATDINDYSTKTTSFDELYYTYQLGGSWDWLTLAAGQFPLYNFDGTAYDSNQQENFINMALSQNMTSTYSTAGVGVYVQAAPNDEWTFVVGGQDATDIDGESVRFNDLDEEHYTTFASISYTPTIKGLGTGQYSVLVYNQPAVKEQPQTTNGWSLNASQNLGEKWAVFARLNGVSGSVATADLSAVLGAVYNNPLDRNPLDQIGAAIAYNKIDKTAVGDNSARPNETILEAYWAWGISKWATITPDIQFYINPALNPKSDYDTVFSLRGSVFF